MNLQQRMTRDLDFLKAAFPHLSEEFPDGRWEAKITSGEENETVGSYSLSFGFDVERANYAGQLFSVYIPLFLIDVCMARHELARYAVEMHDGEDFYLATLASAIEFIGRVSHGLTPINATAAALEARFG